ncbi:MAG: hypothetical protein K9L85_03620, partial [Candidatus Peribacteraceae bacterium]|nr:hypothetical protein [Candidatus Peribacteraceae bacterium]
MPEKTFAIGPDVKNAKQGEGGGGPKSRKKEQGKEWSTDTQNELAKGIEEKTTEELKKLGEALPFRPVQRGDTLGSLAKGLNGGKLDWGMAVDYRSTRLKGAKPERLSEANKIYPGQCVWIEDTDKGKVIVVDDNPPPKPSVEPVASADDRQPASTKRKDKASKPDADVAPSGADRG